MKPSLRNTGDLRSFLLEALHEVRYGHLPYDQAMAVTKMAAQINESVRCEVQASRLLLELGNSEQVFGCLPLGAPATDVKRK